MQIVILAGGLATRLRPLTDDLPKSMVPAGGRPFLEHQIELLKRQGITDIVLCIGHLGQKIRDHFGGGERFGVRIRYSEEGEKLLGTAGAIKKAEPLLDDRFFILYGDSFLMLDYGEIMRYFERFDKLGLMVVYKNHNRWDRSNVVVEGNLVKTYDKKAQLPGMVYIDEGLAVLRRRALAALRPGEVASLEDFYQGLIIAGELLAFETHQRFYEIGSPAGLEEFRQLVEERGVPA